MKEYDLKQSIVIVVVGFAVLWVCLYFFVFPFLAGSSRAKTPRARLEERQLFLSLENYRENFGSYPTGENASLIRALAGTNPKHLKFINVGVHSTNETGEFIDPWNTPYKILLESNSVAILSAGMNRIFGDKDDIVFNSRSNDFVKP